MVLLKMIQNLKIMKKLNRKGFTLVEFLAVIVILAIVIGIHNVPEGLATALTLAGTKMKTSKIILYTVIAGIPMGIGSFLGVYFAGNFNSLIGVFLSIAAGTMLYVVLEEILPRTKNLFCIIGFLIGTIIVYCI